MAGRSGTESTETIADRVAAAPTGAPMARVLEDLDLTRLDAFELEDVAAAYTRMSGWAHAGLAAVAVELSRRPEMAPRRYVTEDGRRGPVLSAERVTALSLAARLLRSPRDLTAVVREGRVFRGVLTDTGRALREGRIAVPAARAIAARLYDQAPQVASPVQDQVLPRAPHRTTTEVKQDLERALLEVDPEHAAERRDTARASRHVTHPVRLPDQMAEMHLVLPAEHAVGIDTALDRTARTARNGGDPRTLDQLRVDALVDAVLSRPTPSTAASAFAAPASPPNATPASAAAAALAAGAAGVDAADAAGTDAAATVADAAGTEGAATAADTDGEAAVPSDWTAAGPRDPRVHVLVTVPFSTLIGTDDQPADLAGYGAIDAATARALAQGGVWQRLVTDPPSGSVLDVGRKTYRPPAALADHVRHRDRTCTFPGCPVPAVRADLDHTRAWTPDPDDPGPPGTTSHDNLAPLCPRHHRAKHGARFHVAQPEPGVHEWTTPSGHRYRTRPGTDEPTEHLNPPAPWSRPVPPGQEDRQPPHREGSRHHDAGGRGRRHRDGFTSGSGRPAGQDDPPF